METFAFYLVLGFVVYVIGVFLIVVGMAQYIERSPKMRKKINSHPDGCGPADEIVASALFWPVVIVLFSISLLVWLGRMLYAGLRNFLVRRAKKGG